MADLLVLGSYPDERSTLASGVFVRLQVELLAQRFRAVSVVSQRAALPRCLRPLAAFSPRLREAFARYDYTRGNISVYFAPRVPWLGRYGPGRRVERLADAMLRKIRREGITFDIVHAHFTHHAHLAARLKQAFDVPAVLTIHENHDWLMAEIEQNCDVLTGAWREMDTILRVSPLELDDIRRVAGPGADVRYLPNGFDPRTVPSAGREQLRRRLGLPADRPIFVMVGYLIPRKDPLICVEAMARLLADNPPVRPMMLLLGADQMNGAVQRRIAELGLGDDVRWLGAKTPADVMKYIRASTAVVLYSRSEGNPTVMFEALGCGRPFIGSDVGGVRFVLTDPRLGRFGPPGDLDALVGLLREALQVDWDEEFIADHARQYSWQTIADRLYEEVYSPLLAARKPPPTRTRKPGL